jgi:hypothetical protein
MQKKNIILHNYSFCLYGLDNLMPVLDSKSFVQCLFCDTYIP